MHTVYAALKINNKFSTHEFLDYVCNNSPVKGK